MDRRGRGFPPAPLSVYARKKETMNRIVLVTMVSLLLLAGMTLFQPQAAHAAMTKPAPQCVVQRVVLHGTQPPTVTCLQTATAPLAARVTPDRSTGCIGDLILYQDANYGGSVLCLSGRGLYNLNNFPINCFLVFCNGTWNDQLSSFSTGQQRGHFAWDINNQGAWYGFSPGQNVSYIGNTWNDQASSVEID
jgi:hypothetical protein